MFYVFLENNRAGFSQTSHTLMSQNKPLINQSVFLKVYEFHITNISLDLILSSMPSRLS